MLLIRLSIIQMTPHMVSIWIIVDNSCLWLICFVIHYVLLKNSITLYKTQSISIETLKSTVYVCLSMEIATLIPIILPAYITPSDLFIEQIIICMLVFSFIVHMFNLLQTSMHLFINEQIGPIGRIHISIQTRRSNN